MLALLLFSIVAFEIPLTSSLPEAAMAQVRELAGVRSARLEGKSLQLELATGAELRTSAIERLLKRHDPALGIDYPNLGLHSRTILQIDAGQCFNCSSIPLKKNLSRQDWVRSVEVVDYAPRGRMLVRVEPRGPVPFRALGRVVYEDVLLTASYDWVPKVDLDWPLASVAWRPSEAAARSEAHRRRKPLLIFPTAGT